MQIEVMVDMFRNTNTENENRSYGVFFPFDRCVNKVILLAESSVLLVIGRDTRGKYVV